MSVSFSSIRKVEYILSDVRFHTMFLLYCGVTGLGSKTGVQAVLVKAADAMFEPEIRSGSALSALCQAISESGNRELACHVMSTCGSNVGVELDSYSILPIGIPWCIEVYGQHTEELRLVIHGGIKGLWPSDVANFLNRMETLVTLTGLELALDILIGKLVYTCTICTINYGNCEIINYGTSISIEHNFLLVGSCG